MNEFLVVKTTEFYGKDSGEPRCKRWHGGNTGERVGIIIIIIILYTAQKNQKYLPRSGNIFKNPPNIQGSKPVAQNPNIVWSIPGDN